MAAGTVKCSYARCDRQFATEKEMKKHKYHDPKHYYCRKCDYDAMDWDDMLDHKIKAMAPFMIGELRHEKHKVLKHLCCEFCGEDFKTMDGRAEHRRQYHQAAHHLPCNGNGPIWDAVQNKMVHGTCEEIFSTPSQLIEHIEKGQCLFVSATQFHTARQHRHILKQLLFNPELFCINPDGMTADPEPSLVDDMSSVDGGVGLIDLEDDVSTVSGIQHLLPLRGRGNVLEQLVEVKGLPSHSQRSKQPAQPSWAPQSTVPSQSSPPGSTTSGTTQKDGRSTSSAHQRDGDNTSDASTVRGSPAPKQRARFNKPVFSMGSTFTAPSWVDIDWEAIEELNLDEDKLPSSNKFLKMRWYDPDSESYDADRFYHPVLDVFKCPFAACQGTFKQQEEMEEHLRRAHVLTSTRCATCSKEFLNVAALMRHFEASLTGSKCTVAYTQGFPPLLADVTGGYLDAARVHYKGGAELLSGVTRVAGQYEVVRADAKKDGVQALRFVIGPNPEVWQSDANIPVWDAGERKGPLALEAPEEMKAQQLIEW